MKFERTATASDATITAIITATVDELNCMASSLREMKQLILFQNRLKGPQAATSTDLLTRIFNKISLAKNGIRKNLTVLELQLTELQSIRCAISKTLDEIEDWEYQTLMGNEKSEARQCLHDIDQAIARTMAAG